MNLFVTNSSPKLSARALDDKRVVKMVLETAQLLSTAINEQGLDGPYKSTHKNHPCAMWVRETQGNYWWTCLHFYYLLDEYFKRYGKVHACGKHLTVFLNHVGDMPEGLRTDFVNCAANQSLGISYKHLDDVFTAYQLYLADRWETDKREPTWYRSSR